MTPGDWAAWTQSRGRDHCASRGGWRSDLAAKRENVTHGPEVSVQSHRRRKLAKTRVDLASACITS